MELQEAKELYKKLKPFENNCKMEGDFIINRFFILPTRKYLAKKKIEIDFYDVYQSDSFFHPMIKQNQEVEIVGIHQASSFTFLPSYNIEHFKKLIN